MTWASHARTVAVELRREDYRGEAAFAWAPTSAFATVEARADAFLHAEEVATLRGLKAERRRISYLMGRYTAKAALARCAAGMEGTGENFEPGAVLIAAGIFSQPVVHGSGARTRGVSISHSDRWVCSLAFPEEHPMAIDVETVDPARTHVMMTQVGAEEGERAAALCGSKDVGATLVWTAKEALSKALRCGMTCPYELLELVDFEARDGSFMGRFKNFGQYKFLAWVRGGDLVTIVLPKRTELGFVFPEVLG